MIINKYIWSFITVTFLISCKEIPKKEVNIPKEEKTSQILSNSEKKTGEIKNLSNMIFFGVEKNVESWLFNDYCGGGSQRIKFLKDKLYHYRPIEETPYIIESIEKENNNFVYKVVSDLGGANEIYSFQYDPESGILTLNKENEKMKYFINSATLDKIIYKRTPCEECYEKSECDKWRKDGSLKEGQPFGYPD
ncbi:hypothetical protein ACSTS3_15135 [Aquimarina muelleri]|uniref:hypothetical protein n=1 Tax=Aquimarina muelleri TaxID=279356 RepID=UPI003F683E92